MSCIMNSLVESKLHVRCMDTASDIRHLRYREIQAQKVLTQAGNKFKPFVERAVIERKIKERKQERENVKQPKVLRAGVTVIVKRVHGN